MFRCKSFKFHLPKLQQIFFGCKDAHGLSGLLPLLAALTTVLCDSHILATLCVMPKLLSIWLFFVSGELSIVIGKKITLCTLFKTYNVVVLHILTEYLIFLDWISFVSMPLRFHNWSQQMRASQLHSAATATGIPVTDIIISQLLIAQFVTITTMFLVKCRQRIIFQSLQLVQFFYIFIRFYLLMIVKKLIPTLLRQLLLI